MLYSSRTFGPVMLAGTVLLSHLACNGKDDKPSKSEFQTLNETPLKVKRTRHGFVADKFVAEYDFQAGNVHYNLSYNVGDQPACEGTYDFSMEKDRWINAASNIKLCRKQMEVSSTDSEIDVIELFFDKSFQLPAQIRGWEQDGYIMVDFYPRPNLAVGGEQQYICDGEFPLDQMLRDVVECL